MSGALCATALEGWGNSFVSGSWFVFLGYIRGTHIRIEIPFRTYTQQSFSTSHRSSVFEIPSSQ